MQLTDWPLVAVALLLIGLTQISFEKKTVLTIKEESDRLLALSETTLTSFSVVGII
jgi:hypothetical protein